MNRSFCFSRQFSPRSWACTQFKVSWVLGAEIETRSGEILSDTQRSELALLVKDVERKLPVIEKVN